MEGIFDAYMVENGGFLTTADLAYESAEVIFDNKFAHLEYEYDKLMMEHEEHLKLIELKILTENGTVDDYEYFIMQEAEAVKKESKGIFGSLLQVIANILKSISKLLFGDDFMSTLGDKEVKVKMEYDPYKLMQEYDQTEEALKKASHGNMGPLKTILAAASVAASGAGFYFKVGKPFATKIGKYVDEKAAEMLELQRGIDGANLSEEDSNTTKSGINKLKTLASRIAACARAIPKALRGDEDFEQTLKNADDRENAEANAEANAKEEAKAAKAEEKAAKKEQKAADKAAKKEQKAADKELKLQGLDPKMKDYIEDIKNDNRDDDVIKKEIEKIKVKIKEQDEILKKYNWVTGLAVDGDGNKVGRTAKGIIKHVGDIAKRKISGDKIGTGDELQTRLEIKNKREQARKTKQALEAQLKYDEAVQVYRSRQQSINALQQYIRTQDLSNFDFERRPITDLIYGESAEDDILKDMLDPKIFFENTDISDKLIEEYGYNPLDEDFDTLVENAFSFD